MIRYLRKRNRNNPSPGTRKNLWSNASSRVNWKWLSPGSQGIRMDAKRKMLETKKPSLQNYDSEIYEIPLAEEQSESLKLATQLISRQDLDSVLDSTAQECGKEFADKLREDWKSDQERNCTSSGNKHRWSLSTYRIALAVYAKSPAAYRALEYSSIFSLPCTRSLQRFLGKYYDFRPGVDPEYLCRQSEIYFTRMRKTRGTQYKGGNGM